MRLQWLLFHRPLLKRHHFRGGGVAQFIPLLIACTLDLHHSTRSSIPNTRYGCWSVCVKACCLPYVWHYLWRTTRQGDRAAGACQEDGHGATITLLTWAPWIDQIIRLPAFPSDQDVFKVSSLPFRRYLEAAEIRTRAPAPGRAMTVPGNYFEVTD